MHIPARNYKNNFFPFFVIYVTYSKLAYDTRNKELFKS